MAHPHDLEEIRARRKEVEERMMADNMTRLFRKEWDACQGDSFSARMARRSLIASARGIPELEAVMAKKVKCDVCRGNGWVWVKSGGTVDDADCDSCDGTGKVTE